MTVEEQLLGHKWPGATVSLQVEIKVKSSLDCLPKLHLNDFLARHYSAERTKELVDSSTEKIEKRHPTRRNQFYFRDVVANPDTPAFFHPDFFSNDISKRRLSLSLLLSEPNNYVRIFTPEGQKVPGDEYTSKLEALVGENYRDKLAGILSQAIDLKMLGAVRFLQQFTGTSLGDLLYRVVSQDYQTVRDQKGVGYLHKPCLLILTKLLEKLDNPANTDINQEVKPIYDSLYEEVKAELVSKNEDIKDLPLQFAYSCLLIVITFCDSSMIIKLEIAKKQPEREAKFAANPRNHSGVFSWNGEEYFWASRNTMIDVGAKKDANVQKLVELYKSLDQYLERL